MCSVYLSIFFYFFGFFFFSTPAVVIGNSFSWCSALRIGCQAQPQMIPQLALANGSTI